MQRGERKRVTGEVVALRPASTSVSDAILVAAVRAGDHASALELYRRYSRDAERMLVRTSGFVPELADLLHDVFVRVLEGIGSLRNPESVRPWIMGIAIRRAQEHLRSRKRDPIGAEVDLTATSGDPETSLELRRVYQLLDRLDDDDRIAFALRRIEGMELTEVGETCGISLATVKRRVARAEQEFTRMASEDPLLSGRLDRRPR